MSLVITLSLAILLTVVTALVAPQAGGLETPRGGAAPGGGGDWVLPVQREVIDRFRPPPSPWGAGNRGWEFATVDGDPVVAVGAGEVFFAGSVAGRGVVTIDHGGGLVSSVTGLSEVNVRPGRPVRAGELMGLARPGVHLGFRLHGVYVDPGLFFARPRHAVLVALPAASQGQ